MRNDPQSGRGQAHVTYFLNFGTSDSITFKRMKLDPSFFLCWIGHGKYYIRDDEYDPKGGVAKVACRTFEAMGQIPMFHRTYFLLLLKDQLWAHCKTWQKQSDKNIKCFSIFTSTMKQIKYCKTVVMYGIVSFPSAQHSYELPVDFHTLQPTVCPGHSSVITENTSFTLRHIKHQIALKINYSSKNGRSWLGTKTNTAWIKLCLKQLSHDGNVQLLWRTALEQSGQRL